MGSIELSGSWRGKGKDNGANENTVHCRWHKIARNPYLFFRLNGLIYNNVLLKVIVLISHNAFRNVLLFESLLCINFVVVLPEVYNDVL